MQKVVIHTDGGCHGNPGPGGWAAVLNFGSHQREISGGAPVTTNNRMELSAAIEALKALGEPCVVELHTDSKYLRDGITKWIRGWKRNGWRTQAKEPVKNEDLWRQLDAAVARHKITWHWVKGHAGHAGNERCDRLAQKAIAVVKQKPAKAEIKPALKAEAKAEIKAGAKAAVKTVAAPIKKPVSTMAVQGLLPLDGF